MELWRIFFDVSRHRIDINQQVHISWLKLLVSVLNELSYMKLIARAEQIGLTWPGTTRRPDQYCNNLKHNRTTSTVQALKINCKCIVIFT